MTPNEITIWNIDLSTFSNKKEELQKLFNQYKDLKINWIDDIEWYKEVDRVRKLFKKTRTEISNLRKEKSSILTNAWKKLIKMEKDFLEIIHPQEIKFLKQQNKIDQLKKIEQRKVLLPDRKIMLFKIDVTKLDISDDEILKLDSDEFQKYYNEKKELYLEEKERKIKEQEKENERQRQVNIKNLENDRIKILEPYKPWNISNLNLWEIDQNKFNEIFESIKYNFEDKQKTERLLKEKKEQEKLKQIEKDKKEAIKQAKQKAELKAKKEKEKSEREHQEALQKVEKEKQDLIKKQADDKAKKEKEELMKKQEKEAEEKKKKEESERLGKEEKYKKFLEKNKWKFDSIKKENWKVILWKKIDEFII